jgi:hypothetical protein
MDNFFKTCPAMMSDGRLFTDYRTATRREQYNKYVNGIVRDDEYRMFMQTNASPIMDTTWNYNKEHNSCFVNKCVHTYPTRVPPAAFPEELQTYNDVMEHVPPKRNVTCSKYADYRATY